MPVRIEATAPQTDAPLWHLYRLATQWMSCPCPMCQERNRTGGTPDGLSDRDRRVVEDIRRDGPRYERILHRQRGAAEQRGRELLMSMLDPAQQQSLTERTEFDFVGSAGTRFRLTEGTSGNIGVLGFDGEVCGWICAHPDSSVYDEQGRYAGPLPVVDHMIGQYLALRTDEPEFWRIANNYSDITTECRARRTAVTAGLTGEAADAEVRRLVEEEAARPKPSFAQTNWNLGWGQNPVRHPRTEFREYRDPQPLTRAERLAAQMGTAVATLVEQADALRERLRQQIGQDTLVGREHVRDTDRGESIQDTYRPPGGTYDFGNGRPTVVTPGTTVQLAWAEPRRARWAPPDGPTDWIIERNFRI
jgi:hypothetical protein